MNRDAGRLVEGEWSYFMARKRLHPCAYLRRTCEAITNTHPMSTGDDLAPWAFAKTSGSMTGAG